MQGDLRTLSAKYGSFADIFEEASTDETEAQICTLVRDVANETAERYQKELRLLPFRS